MIRTALIGVSGFGDTHYREVMAQYEDGRMVPVAATVINQDEEAEKCARLKALGCQLYADHREMFAAWSGKLDLCCIPTGIHLHAPMTIDALRAGANVLVEKPAAATVQEVAAMLRAEADSGRFVAVGYQHAFAATTWLIKQRLLDGAIGTVREIRCRALWPRDSRYYARNHWAGRLRIGDCWVLDSPANNALAHQVNLMCFFGGGKLHAAGRPVSVQAELYRAHPIESFDTIALRVVLAEGPSLLYVVSHAPETVAALGPEIVIVGDRGHIHWSHERVVFSLSDGVEDIPHGDPRGDLIRHLLERFANPDAHICSLAVAARQTLCVNAAHDSSPVIPFPQELVREFTVDGGVRRSVQGLDDAIARAFAGGKTFSELGLPWAQAGRIIDTTDYAWFPGGRPGRRLLA